MSTSGCKARAGFLALFLLAAPAWGQQTPNPGPVQVQVAPAQAAIGLGAQKQFSASEAFIGGFNKPGSARNLSACVKWSSSQPSVASINLNSGLALAGIVGQTQITASCGPFHGSTMLTVQTAVCGDGVRQSGEQCDDANNINLDGCSAVCAFEQNQRINSLTLQSGTDTTCSANALGAKALTATALGQVQAQINADVGNGAITYLFAMRGISDLSGTTEPSFKIGLLGGTPMAGSGYNGASDLDWWYTPDPAAIDANRVPINQVSASITTHALSGGPATLPFPRVFGSVGLQFTNVAIGATTGASSAPLASSNGAPPGYLPAQNLDPALTSYGSMSGGSLCGVVSAASMAAIPAPLALQSGTTACAEGYTGSNSLLDVFVGGCTVLFVTAINPTQPDTSDPSAPPAGAGAPYLLSTNASRQVVSCRDSAGATASLQACLASAAYSGYFKFTSDRVIIK